ncbi:MAG: thiamine pyrophosphate-dependent enzyme [Alphaproteobacteria bacterium]
MAGKPLERRAVVERLLAERGPALVVSGLGSPTYDVAAAGDSERNFYLWGAMGSAVPMGLGLALAQPALPVLVVTGDGEMLMGLGSLATAGVKKPKNLTVVVLDNERYGETGMQPSHSGLGVDLTQVARASGFEWTMAVNDEAALAGLCRKIFANDGCGFAGVKIGAEPLPRTLPSRDGVYLKQRFRASVLAD